MKNMIKNDCREKILKDIQENEEKLMKSEGREKKLFLGKKLSCLDMLLSEMGKKDPLKVIVEMLKKEVEEKFY